MNKIEIGCKGNKTQNNDLFYLTIFF
jgi:hypothetical protein